MKCQKCKSEMEKGSLSDAGDWGTFLPRKQKWITDIGTWGDEKNAKEIVSFRCKKCGYLENYAK